MFQGMVLIFLIICTISDLYKKVIWKPLPLLFMAAVCGMHQVTGDMGWKELLYGILPGLFLLSAGMVTREAIGYGDGMVVLACGTAVGFAAAAGLLILGLFFSAVWSAVLFFGKKAGRKDCFPFVPFLLAAWMAMVSSGMV